MGEKGPPTMRRPIRTLVFALIALLFVGLAIWLASTAHAQSEKVKECLRTEGPDSVRCAELSDGERGWEETKKWYKSARRKPLTRKQFQAYKALRSIGITKEDAARVAPAIPVSKRVSGDGIASQFLARSIA
jgi:hypothetical protein